MAGNQQAQPFQDEQGNWWVNSEDYGLQPATPEGAIQQDPSGRAIYGSAGPSNVAADPYRKNTQVGSFTKDGQRYFQLTDPSDAGGGNPYMKGMIYDPTYGYGIPESTMQSPEMQAHLKDIEAKTMKGSWEDRFLPMLGLAMAAGPMFGAASGMFGGEVGAGLTGTAAADAAGLAQMAADAGLTGQAALDFVASQGAMGSTAAGGGGIGLGASGDASWGVNPRVGPEGVVEQGGVDAMNQALGAQAQTGAVGSGEVGGTLADFMKNMGNLPPGSGSLSDLFQNLDNQGGNGMPFPQLGQAGTSAASTALQRILSGQGTAADYASLAGTAGSSILGYMGAQNQTQAYKDVAAQNLAIGAPYRDRLNASYQPGFDLRTADPLYGGALTQSAEEAKRTVSAKDGNPWGNPGAMGEIQQAILNRTALPAAANYRGQLGQFGGLGLNTSGAAQMAGAGASGGTYDALGYGLSQLTNPQTSLDELLKKLQSGANPYRLNLGGGPT